MAEVDTKVLKRRGDFRKSARPKCAIRFLGFGIRSHRFLGLQFVPVIYTTCSLGLLFVSAIFRIEIRDRSFDLKLCK